MSLCQKSGEEDGGIADVTFESQNKRPSPRATSCYTFINLINLLCVSVVMYTNVCFITGVVPYFN